MILTRRSPFGRRWPHPDAWEARTSIVPHVWTYAYGRTKRKAIKRLEAELAEMTANSAAWEAWARAL